MGVGDPGPRLCVSTHAVLVAVIVPLPPSPVFSRISMISLSILLSNRCETVTSVTSLSIYGLIHFTSFYTVRGSRSSL
jgi:hypothetical protein